MNAPRQIFYLVLLALTSTTVFGQTQCPSNIVPVRYHSVGRSYISISVSVTSSRLCKNAEGAVFPFQVETLEDGVDDAVHGFDVDEADHGPRSSPDFDETAFDDVGGTQLAPQ